MGRFNLIGGSYQSQSVNADAQRTFNWYVEVDESGTGTSAAMLYPFPGLGLFAGLVGENSVPALETILGRTFAATGNLWEIFPPPTAPINRGALTPTYQGTTSMVASATQVLICSGGNLFVLTLGTNAFAAVNMGQFNGPISKVEFSDGFFLALQQNSNVFYVSNLLDPTTWSGLSAEEVNLFPDNVVSFVVSHRELWVGGINSTVAYYNAGLANSPFVPNPSAFVEEGVVSLFGLSKLDNSVFWWGQNAQGTLVARRSNGYTAQRISNHGIETQVQNFTTATDVICYAFQYEGHLFWVSYFPTAKATIVYDVATSLWFELGFWRNGAFTAHQSQCHTYNFGLHLVGDWSSGNVFALTQSNLTDNGNPIRRMRRTPSIATEQEYIFHRELQIYLESGLGPTPGIPAPSTSPRQYLLSDPIGAVWALTVDDSDILHTAPSSYGTAGAPVITDTITNQSFALSIDSQGRILATQVPLDQYAPIVLPIATTSFLQSGIFMLNGQLVTQQSTAGTRDPQLMLRWSDDGGHTWSNTYALNCGQAGEYRKRVIKRRLGRARNRIYEISTTDAIPWRIIDGYLMADGKGTEYKPTERLAKQLGKSS